MGSSNRSEQPFRVGLVGVGRGTGYGRLLSEDPRCRVAACCDDSPRMLEQFARELKLDDGQCFERYEDMLDSPLDAVFLGTPMPLHANQSIAALDSDISVLCEVTAATTIADCQRVAAAAKRSRGVYMLAENCIFWPFVREWKNWIAANRLGEVIHAECEYLHAIPERIFNAETGEYYWRGDRPPLHYCTHSLGPILEMMQDRIVRAMGLGQGHRVRPGSPVGCIDIQVALFETQRGAIIKLLRTSIAPRKPSLHYYMIQGTRGFLETDRGLHPDTGMMFVEGEMDSAKQIACLKIDRSLPAEAQAGGHGTAEFDLVQYFLKALETGKPSMLGVRAAMELTAPGILAHESATKGGVWMDVPSFS